MTDYLDDPELQDPDGDSGDSQFNWDEEFQRHIIALLLMDRTFLLQSMDLIKPSYFTNKAHQRACKLVYEFFKKYRTTPDRTILVQELKENLKEDKSQTYYLAEINGLFDYFEPSLESREYLSDKITFFAKIQALRQAFNKSLKLIGKEPENEETWSKVYELLRQAMNTDKNFDVGLEYFKTIKDRYERMMAAEDNDDRFITGYEDIDREIKGGGYRRGEMIAVVAGSGIGKCFAKGTPILLFDGRTKVIEDVTLDDVIMGDDSTPRHVRRLIHGQSQMFQVKPFKGNPFVVNCEHILVLKSSDKNRHLNSKWRCEDGLYQISVKDFLKENKRFQKDMKLIRTGVIFDHQAVKIDPYILGVWLGDGSSRVTKLTSMDNEIVEAWKNEANKRGLNILESNKNPPSLASDWYMGTEVGHHINSLKSDLRHYNLLENKHVPHVYKANSEHVRKEILAGLIDTDGSLVCGCYEFVNKNQTLAEDVVFLARSLGIAAYYGDDKVVDEVVYKRVFISGNISQIPVRVPRKQAKDRTQIKNPLVTGFEIEPCGMDNYFGFELDGNHRHLLGDFTITHNSVWMTNVVAANVLRGKKCLYLACGDADQDRVAERFDAVFTGRPVQCLYDIKEEIFSKLDELVAHRQDQNLLVVKWFPSNSANINTVRAYLAQVRFYGYHPDMVVVDYVGEMKNHPDMPTHESRELLVKELRGMGGEEKVFVVTAMQPNRGSKEAQQTSVIEEEHLADSFGQIRPLDACFSLNQNKNEDAVKVGRMWVIKQRFGKKRYFVWLKFDAETLRISAIHHDTYSNLMSRKIDDISKSVEESMVDNVIGKGLSPEEQSKKVAKMAASVNVEPIDCDNISGTKE